MKETTKQKLQKLINGYEKSILNLEKTVDIFHENMDYEKALKYNRELECLRNVVQDLKNIL